MLFGGAEARAAAGNIVPFVLAFNFGAGLLYVLGGLATLLRRPWAVWVARVLALSTVAVFVALGVHVLSGSAHEIRTLFAMTLRSGFWIVQALLLSRLPAGGQDD